MPARPRVFITRPIPDEAIARIEQHADVDVWWVPDQLPPTGDRMPHLEGLLTYSHEPITDQMMASAPRLDVISACSVGYDHIDVGAASRRGIRVGNTPGVLTDTTADMTLALLLAAARNIVAGRGFVHSGQWEYYDPTTLWGREVHHTTARHRRLGSHWPGGRQTRARVRNAGPLHSSTEAARCRRGARGRIRQPRSPAVRV